MSGGVLGAWSDASGAGRAAALARAGRLAGLGPLLDASHASLRDDRVSCEELDATVSAARAAGALGARMIGGGFGGSVLALVPAARDWAAPRALVAVPAAGGGRAG